jgi:hypothetical protein
MILYSSQRGNVRKRYVVENKLKVTRERKVTFVLMMWRVEIDEETRRV